MMYSYLITPKFVLGSDSFYVQAQGLAEAIAEAKKRIEREGWSSQNGWTVLMEITDFQDEEARRG